MIKVSYRKVVQRDLQVESKLTGQPVHRSPLERTRVGTPKEIRELKLFAKQIGPPIAASYNNLGVHAAMTEKYAEAAGYFALRPNGIPTWLAWIATGAERPLQRRIVYKLSTRSVEPLPPP